MQLRIAFDCVIHYVIERESKGQRKGREVKQVVAGLLPYTRGEESKRIEKARRKERTSDTHMHMPEFTAHI